MRIESQLSAIARGHRDAFSALYRETRPSLLYYATGLMAGDRSSAEDAVNDAFIAIWQQAGNFNGSGSAEGWIRRIVRNKAVDQMRRQREVPMTRDAEAKLNQFSSSDGDAQDRLLIEAEVGRQLGKALQSLSVEHREVIWLCYYEERRLSDIAKLVGCPENTVKTRLFHARKLLAKSGVLDNGIDA